MKFPDLEYANFIKIFIKRDNKQFFCKIDLKKYFNFNFSHDF